MAHKTRREQVVSFFKECKTHAQAVFLEHERYLPSQVIQCDKKGSFVVSPDVQSAYNLAPGVQGIKGEEQGFRIVFHEVLLTPSITGLDVADIQFEDPRDCSDVIKELEFLYKRYCK